MNYRWKQVFIFASLTGKESFYSIGKTMEKEQYWQESKADTVIMKGILAITIGIRIHPVV